MKIMRFKINLLKAVKAKWLLPFFFLTVFLCWQGAAHAQTEDNASPQISEDTEPSEHEIQNLLPPEKDPEIPVETVEDAPPPETQELQEPVENINALPVPALSEEEIDENLFFDAEALVPTGEMGRKGGPRKVNPKLEPGSKLIIVEKNYGKGTTKAQLVAAGRAVKLGRYDSAVKIYEKLYDENKNDPNAVLGLAIAYQYLGYDEQAIRKYEELLSLKPQNIEAQVNMLGLIGERYPAVALRQLLDLYDKNPGNVGVAAQIAVMQAKLARYDEAIQYLGMAASMEPNNPLHVFNMAVIADRTGNKKEAVKYYERALEIDVVYGGKKSIPRDAVYERLARLR